MSAEARAERTVTVSVVSHGQAALVAALLADLRRYASRSVARVVVTHNLADGADFRSDPALEVVQIRNAQPRGFAANHNAAFRSHCDTQSFAVVNPDIRLPADPFPSLLSAAAHEAVALVVPRIVGPDGSAEDARRALLTPADVIAGALRRRQSVERPAWVAGMFMLFRAEAYRALGGFDPRFRLYCEDFDICARIRLAGWDFALEDSATVIHEARRASRRSLQPLLWHVQSLLRVWTSPVFWRYRGWLRRHTVR